jgi:hypothetical protein
VPGVSSVLPTGLPVISARVTKATNCSAMRFPKATDSHARLAGKLPGDVAPAGFGITAWCAIGSLKKLDPDFVVGPRSTTAWHYKFAGRRWNRLSGHSGAVSLTTRYSRFGQTLFSNSAPLGNTAKGAGNYLSKNFLLLENYFASHERKGCLAGKSRG